MLALSCSKENSVRGAWCVFRRTRLNTVICSSMTGVGDGSDRALVCSEEDVQRYLEDTRAGFDKSCGNSRLMD